MFWMTMFCAFRVPLWSRRWSHHDVSPEQLMWQLCVTATLPQRTCARHDRFSCFLNQLNQLNSCSFANSGSSFIPCLLSPFAFALFYTEPEWVNRRKQVLPWPGSAALWPASLKWSCVCPANPFWTATRWKSRTLVSSSWCRAKASGLRWVWAECV